MSKMKDQGDISMIAAQVLADQKYKKDSAKDAIEEAAEIMREMLAFDRSSSRKHAMREWLKKYDPEGKQD